MDIVQATPVRQPSGHFINGIQEEARSTRQKIPAIPSSHLYTESSQDDRKLIRISKLLLQEAMTTAYDELLPISVQSDVTILQKKASLEGKQIPKTFPVGKSVLFLDQK